MALDPNTPCPTTDPENAKLWHEARANYAFHERYYRENGRFAPGVGELCWQEEALAFIGIPVISAAEHEANMQSLKEFAFSGSRERR